MDLASFLSQNFESTNIIGIEDNNSQQLQQLQNDTSSYIQYPNVYNTNSSILYKSNENFDLPLINYSITNNQSQTNSYTNSPSYTN